MDKIKDWFSSLPPLLLGSIVVVAGILFMVFADPPKTVCDSQFDSYRAQLNHYIFPKEMSSNLKLPPLIETHYRACLNSNSPGGCLEYIQGLKNWWRYLKTISSSCGEEFDKIKPTKDWMVKTLTLFVEIAWGDEPPETFRKKTAWLEKSDLVVYCGIKREFVRFFGNQEWTNLREKIMQKLPGAVKMERVDMWEKTILSIACDQILNLSE